MPDETRMPSPPSPKRINDILNRRTKRFKISSGLISNDIPIIHGGLSFPYPPKSKQRELTIFRYWEKKFSVTVPSKGTYTDSTMKTKGITTEKSKTQTFSESLGVSVKA